MKRDWRPLLILLLLPAAFLLLLVGYGRPPRGGPAAPDGPASRTLPLTPATAAAPGRREKKAVASAVPSG